MATAKAKVAKKSDAKKGKGKASSAKTVDTVEAKTTKKENKVVIVSKETKKKNCGLFARKFDASENILTIFKDTKIIGALLGEIIGTALVTGIVLTLGLYNPLYWIFGYVAITLAVFKLSGAHLNPVITAGMLATRRISAIRGALYIIAQIIGAWLGYTLIGAFYKIGLDSGNIDAANVALPTFVAAGDATAATEGFSFFWPFTFVELLGSVIIAFFFARALNYKKKALPFAITVAAGSFVAMLFAVVINNNFFYLNDNSFAFNPAISMMLGLFPSSAENFSELMGALWPMIVTHVLFPVLGGIIGFFLSDIAANFSEQELAN